MTRTKNVLILLLAVFFTVGSPAVRAAELFEDGSNAETEIQDEVFSSGADESVEDAAGDQMNGIAAAPEEYITDAGATADESIFDESGISLFSDEIETYEGAYGLQLEGFGGNGYAKACYDLLTEKLTADWSIAGSVSQLTLVLDTPIVIEGEVSVPAAGENAVIQRTESYLEQCRKMKESVSAAWAAFQYDNPEFFWSWNLNYGFGKISYERKNAGETAAVITIKSINMVPNTVYGNDTQTVINTFQENIARAVQELTAQTEGGTDYEKVKAIHDYVCENAWYDTGGVITAGAGTNSQYRRHCAGPIFAGDGGVVCEGYAKAMKILCERMGIPCVCVVGRAAATGSSAGEAHMWNYIRMDNGRWYLADATWDDGASVKTVYLLMGSASKGKNILISEERVNSSTFYTLRADDNSPDGYLVKNFVYPDLAGNSYLSETGRSSLAEARMGKIGVQAYTGKAVSPEITVSFGNSVLREGTDYTVSYSNNVSEGTAVVLVRGMGGYVGAVRTSFEIRCSHSDAKFFGSVSGSCTEPGNIAYWHCGVCGRYFKDEGLTEEISEAETLIAAVGHSFGEYQITVWPTVLTEGVKTAVCSCGQAITESIPKLTPTITVSVKDIPLRVKQSYKVKVTGLGTGDAVKSWKSDKPKVASVNKYGKITAKKTGTARITVTLKSGISRTIRIRVQNTPVKTTKLTVSARKVSLKRKQIFRISVTVTPITSKQKVTYTSSDNKVAAVSPSGKITAKKKGTAMITVQSGAKKAKVRVTVN